MQNDNIFLKLTTLYLFQGDDISSDDIVDELHYMFSNILKDVLDNKNMINNLDFEVIKIRGMKEGYKIVPNNAITAFWTSGILLDADKEIGPDMVITIDRVDYWYDEKRKILKHK